MLYYIVGNYELEVSYISLGVHKVVGTVNNKTAP